MMEVEMQLLMYHVPPNPRSHRPELLITRRDQYASHPQAGRMGVCLSLP